ATYILLIEGLPLLGFIYYLEYKKRMFLLTKDGQKVEPAGSILEKRLVRGVFLSLSGSALIYAPNIAGTIGLNSSMTYEMFLTGVVVICAGLAILLSCAMLRFKSVAPSEDMTRY
ncbi:MAG TPA: hypothetical protein VN455_08070, partial [Methanotrichaceae archaeon]|nr:hypothetical protein [Methanotrichaceae archaeon]